MAGEEAQSEESEEPVDEESEAVDSEDGAAVADLAPRESVT